MEHEPLRATLDARREGTRLLVMHDQDEVLRAVLAPPTTSHPRGPATLLEGLALWYQRRLAVALCVGDRDCSSSLHLYDALGVGDPNVHYSVAVVPRDRRGRRLNGLGRFGDLRQLCFEVVR